MCDGSNATMYQSDTITFYHISVFLMFIENEMQFNQRTNIEKSQQNLTKTEHIVHFTYIYTYF